MLLIFLLFVCLINVVIYHEICFIPLHCIGAEILRICRATSHYNFFLISARSLINRMRKQGADTQGIQRVITKMIGRNLKPFEKYGIAAEQIAIDISSST